MTWVGPSIEITDAVLADLMADFIINKFLQCKKNKKFKTIVKPYDSHVGYKREIIKCCNQ